ncbi:MAG TPA: hypothetical protein VI055_06350 [Rubrobacter sp.]
MVLQRRFPWYPEHFPEELKADRAWVCCDASKIPLIAGTRRRASHSDPRTWRSYATAQGALRTHPERYAGVGRVITAPYVGVDLDGVRDPSTRELSPGALAILRELSSYCEVSPSGEGVKVWVRATLPRSYRKPGLEVYAARRYFTCTGAFLGQFSLGIEERQAELEELVAREFPRPKTHRDHTDYQGPAVGLDEYLEHVEVLGEVPDSAGLKLAIVCPWLSQHTNQDRSGTYVGRYAEGGPWFRCWHSHCDGRTWREFRNALRIRAKKLRLIHKGVYA